MKTQARGKAIRRILALAAMVALSVGLNVGKAAASEFEVVASSLTADNQVNLSSVAYFGGMTTAPGNPATNTNMPNAGGIYFDGSVYKVWAGATAGWVQISTQAVGSSSVSGGGLNHHMARWNGNNTLGDSDLVYDSIHSLTLAAVSSFTVQSNGLFVGNLGVGASADSAANALDVEGTLPVQIGTTGGMTVASSGGMTVSGSGNVNINPSGTGAVSIAPAAGNVTIAPTDASKYVTIMGMTVNKSATGPVTFYEGTGTAVPIFKLK